MPTVDISKRELETMRQMIADYDRRLAADDADIEPIELTDREQEILILLASGYDNAQMANICGGIATQTIKNHLTSIFNKLNAQSARHAVAIAIKLNLVHVEDINPRI